MRNLLDKCFADITRMLSVNSGATFTGIDTLTVMV